MATETAPGRAPETLVETRDADEFAALLKQSFKPRTERAATEVENAVNTLVEQALADTSLVKADVLDTLEEMIAALDKKLSAQLNEIMHAPEFQQIESAWRGLKYLVFQSETDAMLKIRVMNVSKNELYRHLRQYPNAAWDQSPIFKKIYEEEFGQFGGQPYGCLVGDYSFSHLPTDVQLLRDLSKIAGAAHAPFFAAADSTLMGMDSWNELMNPRDLTKIFETPEYAAWKSLRDCEDSPISGSACRVFWRGCPMARRPSRWRNSTSRKTPTDKGRQILLVQRGLRDGHQHQPGVQAVWLVRPHPRHRVRRRGRGPAGVHLPDRRRRRR